MNEYGGSPNQRSIFAKLLFVKERKKEFRKGYLDGR